MRKAFGWVAPSRWANKKNKEKDTTIRYRDGTIS